MAAADALARLSETDRARALERYTLLRPFLIGGVPLTRLVGTPHPCLRTLRTWVASYRRAGLVGLARTRRADQGRRRFPTELVQLIEGLALRKPAPTAASIHRQVVTVAREHGWSTPSYRTVAAVIQGLDPALLSLAHDGAKAYWEAFDRANAGLSEAVSARSLVGSTAAHWPGPCPAWPSNPLRQRHPRNPSNSRTHRWRPCRCY